MSWRKKRVKLIQRINRLPDITVAARFLWVELAMNWCWEGPDCFPNQKTLAVGLSVHTNTISRAMTELENKKLLKKIRGHRGYQITLATEIPKSLIVDEWRFDNRKLTQRVKGPRKSKQPGGDAVRSDPQKQGIIVQTDEDSSTKKVKTDPQKQWITPERSTNMVGSDPQIWCVDVSSIKGSSLKEEEEKQSKEKRTRSEKSESFSKIEKVVVALKNQGVDNSDPDEMEDPFPLKTQYRKNKRNRNSPSSALVDLPGHGLRTASQPPDGTKTVEVGPPALKQPQDVLALLRGEIEEKYGSKSCVSIPLQLTGKERSQVRSVILGRYAPSVVIGMIRVLVWDWEVARTTCFPFRHQSPIPTVEALVQYQETLASAVTTGLSYDGSRRGEWNTYSARYLKNDPVGDTLPF